MKYRFRSRVAGLFALSLVAGLVATSPASAGGDKVFLDSALSVTDTEVVLPAYEGQLPNGEAVWFIVTEASDGDVADDLGVNEADKLENAAGSGAVQDGYYEDGVLHFSAGVDFSPVRVVNGTPGTGFPPAAGTQPGSVGEEGYSPLVQLPDGTILNAPQVGRASQPNDIHDSVSNLDIENGTATVLLVDGFARGKAVKYISTDASAAGPAALEGATYAPALNDAPGLGDGGSDSSRSGLAAFTNGQTGVDNRDRQGLNSALLGEGDPLNLLDRLPNQGQYSPLWDVHLSTWTDRDDAELIDKFADVEDLAEDGDVTAPDGSNWGASGFIVNCPVISRVD